METVKEIEKEELPPDDLRCKRTDGRDWRCKKPALPGKSLCESHLNRCSSSSSKKEKPHNNVHDISNLTPDPNPNPNPNPEHKPILIRIRVSKPEILLDNNNPGGDGSSVVPVIALPAVQAMVKQPPREDVVGVADTAREDVVGVDDLAREGEEKNKKAVLARERVKVVAAPDHVRCHRNDGRTWRCKREVVEGQTLCEVHFNQSKSKKSTTVRRARMKRPSVNDVEERDGGEDSVMRKGPRVKRLSVSDVVEREGSDDGTPIRQGPRVKRPAINDLVERQVSDDDTPIRQGPRVKRPSVSDVMERDRSDDGMPIRQGLRVKRPLVNDVEKREGNDGGVLYNGEGLRCSRDSGRGWRCERQAKEGYAMCEVHLSGGKGEKAKKKAKGTGKRKVSVEVEKVPNAVRCTRNDGKDWRCKRRVVEGQTLCEAHFKGVKLCDVGTSEVQKVVKKRKKGKKDEGCELLEVKKEVGVEEDEGNQLAMVADVAVAEAERREGEHEEELRCKRTDGRGWRCKRRVVDGKTLCEIHFEQGRLRQKRITVPESMKIQRGDVGGEKVEKRLKRKRALEILENNSDKGMKKMKNELIRVFLRREIIEQNKKGGKGKSSVSNTSNVEVTRDLPYGFMAIPPAPPAQILGNAESLGIKVGVHSSNSLAKRRFRSKNIEPPPVGAVKAVPFAGNTGIVRNSGKKKCHWCRSNDLLSLTKCLSCRKRFFCSNCIKERNIDPEELKLKCPTCCGSCDCKTCLASRSKVAGTKENLKGRCKGNKYTQLEYLINLLMPILEQINEEQNVEAEMEARLKGQNLSEVSIRQADVGCRDQCCCNNCKTPILDFHRSCPNCSYNLCLSCCREYSQGYLRGSETSCSKDLNKINARLPGLRICSEKINKSSSTHSTGNDDLAATDSLPDSASCHHISCPPMEFGGCDNSLLDLRCIFPLNWTKELEISAKETSSITGSQQTTEDSVHCSSCVAQAAIKTKESLEASRRRESHDNVLYCPSSSDDRHDVLFHFQKHWRKGHPVKVRNVIESASSLSWDPLAMFCSYLENEANDSVNMKDPIEAVNCSGWFEVQIGTRESFAHSLEDGYAHRRHENIRIKAKLSPIFSRRLLDGHYSEIIQALPLQEYTNPRSGLLNIAGKLPEDFPVFELGPHVYISFGSREVLARGELVTKLHCNSYDVVNILVHVGDAPCPMAQLSKIKKLIRRSDTKDKGDHSSPNPENEAAKVQSENSGQDKILEGSGLSHRTGAAACCSAATNDAAAGLRMDAKSPTKLQSSDTESDASMICSGTTDGPDKSVDQMSNEQRVEGSIPIDQRPPSDPRGALWDVFRREDVPKLLEYILKHVDQLSFSYDFPKDVVHPIFDGSFYLDATHKLQLKEEFDVEPWTFTQSLGEAVLIPAGCPYQIRNFKTCVNVAVGFISPENASECIKLIKEIRLLPNNHKAKQEKLEVEKMTICSVDEAIKEIYRLKSEEASHPEEGVLIPIANS